LTMRNDGWVSDDIHKTVLGANAQALNNSPSPAQLARHSDSVGRNSAAYCAVSVGRRDKAIPP
jgi:hypothetical protein